LLALLERLANDARSLDGWPGLLIGDMAQPRGGPMITGHESHQIGLDADIWLTPMPDRWQGPELARQGAALVGPLLSFPCADHLPTWKR
jgi:penicillin-insensitive murein DD-endopeptidase